MLCAPSADAKKASNCSPEGTWYGYNDEGLVWIVTISKSGPKSYTTVMDNSINPIDPALTASTDWRGEFVKSGPRTYKWTTMAFWSVKTAPDQPIPFGLGLWPLTARFTSCNSWEGTGECSFYGFFNHDADPFKDGFLLFSNPPLQALFKRMPMTFPTN
jgi:hypothetical protein